MSARRTIALLVTSAALLAGCGEASTGAPAPSVRGATPQVAWLEGRTTHVVQGDVERELEGEWNPWLWLPNGDLLMHTPSDSSGMAVYRPSTGDVVVETDDEWGRDRYDGGEYGLDGETGALTAPDALLRIVDGDQPADLDQGPAHALVDYDLELEEVARVDLPAADEPGRYRRDYDFPVRVGAVTFITFEDVRTGGDLDASDSTTGGVVRVEGGQVTVAARAAYVQRLFLSSDAASVLAVTSESPPEMGDVVPDEVRKSVVELDPVTGGIARDLGAPDAYDGTAWQVERVDRVGSTVAIEIVAECGDAGDCVPRRTWTSDGGGWSEVAEQRGDSWSWQSGTAAVTYEPSGAISWTDGDETRKLAGKRATGPVASGSLLPPP